MAIHLVVGGWQTEDGRVWPSAATAWKHQKQVRKPIAPNFYRNPKVMQRHEQLAEAFYKVARANHYMIGITENFTDDELIGAYGVLIDCDNAASNKNKTLELALDIVEMEKRARHLS